jgi:leucyl-tRNA synthetase
MPDVGRRASGASRVFMRAGVPGSEGKGVMSKHTERYDPSAIEGRWQARWAADRLYERPAAPTRRHYLLTMYPYPSGNLHIGHWYAFTPVDARGRFMRMRGHDVFVPLGFDAFGLPAENAAIKHGADPRVWTEANIDRMRVQFRSMGAMFDWSAEVVTSHPDYYRWNQWFFLKFLEAGLAYRKFAAVDFCPGCNTTLAREQVVGEARQCERCGTPVVRKDLEQWFLRITRYADELLDGLDGIDWPDRVKVMQRNWIGRSEGAEIQFPLPGSDDRIATFTTRPDTLYGVTAIVIAPEHPWVDRLTTPAQAAAVEAYRLQAARSSEIDRLAADRDKTGVWTGSHATHPLTGAPVPIWIADYVLTSYGTGAVMFVPAHDERDFAFAVKYGLPIVEVIRPADRAGHPVAALSEAYVGPGVMVNSGPCDGIVSTAKYAVADWTPELAASCGLPADLSGEGKQTVVAMLEKQGLGRAMVTTRLRDWLISRQRYWGTPIPIVYCGACGTVPVPYEALPVVLPEDVAFVPTGESPLKAATDWVTTTCPRCGGPARRDTDTMDTFVDSSWYQYRYLSPHYAHGPFDPAAADWLPIEQYCGGIEHATMHLLYTRFWTKVMRDLGLVTFDEPMLRLYNQGTILGEDSEKMSKSRGNVTDPDDLVARHGADAVRVYLMFIGPWDQGGPWDPRGIQGVVRWLRDIWALATEAARARDGADGPTEAALRRATHQTIRKVTADMAAFGFNTAVAALMEFRNTLKAARDACAGGEAWDEALDAVLLMLAPLAPHIAEELWARRGRPYSIHQQPWPVFDPALAAEETFEMAVQIMGKVRDRVMVPVGVTEDDAMKAALGSLAVQHALQGRTPRRVIYVPGRLVNIVV